MRKIFTIFVLAISGLIFMAAQSHAISVWFDDPSDFSVISSTEWKYDFSQDVPGLATSMNIQGNGGALTWDSTDFGLGIGNDEITGGTSQAMKFSFSESLMVKSFYLVDLFPNEGNGMGERAFYSIDGMSLLGPTGPGESSGDFTLLLNSIVNEITFSADDLGFGRWNDYAVAGLEFEPAPVPEPGTLLLLGIGLFGVGYFGWKRRYFEK